VNRTWALRPGEYAQGPRVVSTTLRPVRPAVLIPEDDPGMAARFARSRSLAWGGHACYALPFSCAFGPWRSAAMPVSGAKSRARWVACYAELLRRPILRRSGNKGKKTTTMI
jgi:hypothetical protein